jgi:hypothetical protein
MDGIMVSLVDPGPGQGDRDRLGALGKTPRRPARADSVRPGLSLAFVTS